MKCHFCKEEINTKKERYVHVEDWDKEKMIKEIWSHLICFKKAMNRELTQLEKQAQAMLKKAGNIFNSDSFNEMFPKEKEEYIIT